MRNIAEELYYGNITPCDRDIIKGGTFGCEKCALLHASEARASYCALAQCFTAEKLLLRFTKNKNRIMLESCALSAFSFWRGGGSENYAKCLKEKGAGSIMKGMVLR